MWKKFTRGVLAVVLCIVLAGMGFGCKAENTAPDTKISAAQAKAFMESGKPYVLLDVRTEEEFRTGHIQGAVLIPYTEIRARAASELPDKNALILVYCRSGRRSAIAARELVQLGYTRVYDFGGITDWPYATVAGPAAVGTGRP